MADSDLEVFEVAANELTERSVWLQCSTAARERSSAERLPVDPQGLSWEILIGGTMINRNQKPYTSLQERSKIITVESPLSRW